MTTQLILPRGVIAIAIAVSVDRRPDIVQQLALALDPRGRGELSAADVHATLLAMRGAFADPLRLVTDDALKGAIREWREAAGRMTHVPDPVSVHAWDPLRDGAIEPCVVAERLPQLPAGAHWL